MKLMIMGYGRHGKDTVAEYLRDHYGMTFESSSHAAAEALFPLLETLFPFDDVEHAFQCRHWTLDCLDNDSYPREVRKIPYRKIWYEAIRLLNSGDPTTLAKKIFAKSDLYVGIRSKEEFDACRKEGLFDIAIWVDRSAHAPTEARGSCSVSWKDAEYLINNNGTLENTYRNIDELMEILGVQKK